MVRQVGALALLALATLGCAARGVRVESESPGIVAPPVVMPLNARMLPTGTDLYVQLDNRVGTRESRVGDPFSATVRHSVYAQNGARVVPAGAKVYGRVTGLDDSDYPGEETRISLDFNRLAFGGRSYPLEAIVTMTPIETSRERHGLSERVILIGAAIGAALGGVFSGGEIEGVLGGAAAGALAGTVFTFARGDVEAALPAGSRMTLRTTRPITLRPTARVATTRRRR
ncbi:MAG: hypothetical protein ABR499_21090 [Gemmatimonadaceae bacterium]